MGYKKFDTRRLDRFKQKVGHFLQFGWLSVSPIYHWPPLRSASWNRLSLSISLSAVSLFSLSLSVFFSFLLLLVIIVGNAHDDGHDLSSHTAISSHFFLLPSCFLSLSFRLRPVFISGIKLLLDPFINSLCQ